MTSTCPRKNGLQCLKEIRRNDRLKDISKAIYLTSNSQKDIEETFRNRANFDIHKPAYFNILKQVFKKAVMTANQYEQQGMNREISFTKDLMKVIAPKALEFASSIYYFATHKGAKKNKKSMQATAHDSAKVRADFQQ